MTKLPALLLTLWVASAIAGAAALAEVVTQENLKTHLRWNLRVPRDQFHIVKRDQTLFIETVNLELFEALAGEAARLALDPQYLAGVSATKENFPARPATVAVKLKDSSIELFSFYRDADKKYILDFWINKDLAVDSPARPPALAPAAAAKVAVAPEPTPPRAPLPGTSLLDPRNGTLPIVEATQAAADEKEPNPGYRDFRYGASFFWDYPAMIPQLEKDVNLASKVPDSLYPIRDRTALDDPKEAHLQLSINFYRENKWGLMNKSITLYEKKYGRDANLVVNEFLKVNALLKDNLAKPNRGISQSAMAMLLNIKDLSKDYELRSSILRYLLQYHVDNRDFVKTLELAKELYVEARGAFDQTLVIQSALTILHALAELRQIEKIEAFLRENKKLDSILPPQMSMAYATFALISRGETGDLIRRYRLVEKSLAKPVHPAILYNLGESYFREADYSAAVKVYDEFLASYSYLLQAPHARLRLALAYELLDRPAAENLVLYKNAIDRSTAPEVRYEAKLRYVALRIARKRAPGSADRETEIFLEQSPDEARALTPHLKKLLWLVRLRLFIANREYDKALSYLTSIPLDALKPAERRVFEGDGAEVVYGIIQDAYLKEDYARVVKLWEIYKDKYEAKVAKNLYLNFVACDAFLKLGLYRSYDRALASFRAVEASEGRTYPVWIERLKSTELAQLIDELSMIRLVADANWEGAEAKLASFPVPLRDSVNFSYYQGLVHLKQKRYTEAVTEFEKVLVLQNPQNRLTPRQTADLLMGYVDALYQLKDQARFKTVVRALNEDVGRSTSAPILNISERINYLLIEAFAGEGSPDWKELETMTKAFRGKFQKSPYSSRIGYLYGLSLIKNAKLVEGREVFTKLTNDASVPAHIKEMCRGELAVLELQKKKL
jgi:hypothetical protein